LRLGRSDLLGTRLQRAVLDAAIRRERAADLRRVVLQTPLGEPGGTNIAEELSNARNDER